MYLTESFDTWEEFKARLGKYLSFDFRVRRGFLFRGQAAKEWKLEPTLVRLLPKQSDGSWPELEAPLSDLISEFRRCCFGLRSTAEHPGSVAEWEYLGRHHGLPTSILDWTESPYIAAYFALSGLSDSQFASVWVLDEKRVDWADIDGVTIEDYGDTTRFNDRSAEQRGVSMRCSRASRAVEELLPERLIRLDIPRTQRQVALDDLDEMLVNERTLFRTFDASARLATIRCGYL
jgi:hypothetical protein